MVFIFRHIIFVPTDLTKYGTFSEPVISDCTVPGESYLSVRCTDVGEQTSISHCVPNPDTGFYCYENGRQSSASKILVSTCVPTCTAFKWEETNITPCLLDGAQVGTTQILTDPSQKWCNPKGQPATRVREYLCTTHDGSGPNACTFLCDLSENNADCTATGELLTYSPKNALLESVTVPTQLVHSGNGNYAYTPMSSTVNGRVVSSNKMTVTESCQDLSGFQCGNWTPTTEIPTDPILKECTIFGNVSGTGVITPNTIDDLYKTGFTLTDLECKGDDIAVTNVRCNPEDACIDMGQIPGEASTLSGQNIPNLCAEFTSSGGNVTSIIEPQKEVDTCLYMDHSYSSPGSVNAWSGISDFSYFDASDTFHQYKGIVSVPLYITTSTGFLSVYNAPCPSFTITNQPGNIIDYDFALAPEFSQLNAFVNNADVNPPHTGIPYRFNCKGNHNVPLAKTPCTMIPINPPSLPSAVYGVSTDCDAPTGISSQILEQTAMMIFIKPISTDNLGPGPRLKCNILAIFGSSKIGWLTWGQMNTIPGYSFGDGNTLGLGTNVGLAWNHGRFDEFPSTEIPGSKLADLGAEAVFHLVQGSGYTPSVPVYTLKTSTDVQIETSGIDSSGALTDVLENFTFTASTINGDSAAYSSSSSEIIIDGTRISELLYSRSNEVDGSKCNIMLV
jgi:hypothetical protein